MKTVVSDAELVAYCGLYCGACKAYLLERCPGCHKNEKASWCKIRTCCLGQSYSSCAECRDFKEPKECGKFNNFISKVFGFLFRSDRAACIRQIKKNGLKGHADIQAKEKKHSIRPGTEA